MWIIGVLVWVFGLFLMGDAEPGTPAHQLGTFIFLAPFLLLAGGALLFVRVLLG